MRSHKSKGHMSVNPSHHHGQPSDDFAAPKTVAGAAPTASAPGRASPGGLRGCIAGVSAISVLMWILNGVLICASVFALSNWTTVNWMTGSYGWAALLEILALLLVLYLFLAGGCLFGWQARVEASFMHLSDSPQLLSLFALAIPFLAVSFFGLLALLALVNLPATNLFIQSHAEDVFHQATAGLPDPSRLLKDQFVMYICRIPTFTCAWLIRNDAGELIDDPELKGADKADDPRFDFKKALGHTFDSMDRGSKGWLDIEDVYRGVLVALQPFKQRFGFAVLAITVVCLVQFGLYWVQWMKYQKTHKQEKDKEAMPFIGP